MTVSVGGEMAVFDDSGFVAGVGGVEVDIKLHAMEVMIKKIGKISLCLMKKLASPGLE